MNSPFFSLHPLSTTMWLVLSLSFSINCVCAMQILVSQNVPVWYHRYLTYTSAHYWEKMTQWPKLRNFLGTCVIYNPSICSVILLYAWPEAVIGKYTESSIFLCKYSPLLTAYELCTKEKIGSHGKFRISYYCIQRICCKCLWGFNLFERTNIQGAKGWRLPHNIATILEFGSV